jgi:hypothetical protein
MDARTPVVGKLLTIVYVLAALVYALVAGFFLVSGLRLPSSGSLLIGLACLSGTSLFLTPLWLMRELKRQQRVMEEVLRLYAKPRD